MRSRLNHNSATYSGERYRYKTNKSVSSQKINKFKTQQAKTDLIKNLRSNNIMDKFYTLQKLSPCLR